MTLTTPGAREPQAQPDGWEDLSIERHVLGELGLTMVADGPDIRGRARVVPHACVPGTTTLRTSVLAAWADTAAGTLAGIAFNPRIPVTLDLEVQLTAHARVGDTIDVVASTVKAGRSILVCEVRFHLERTGELAALAHGSFLVSPNPDHVLPSGFPRSLDYATGQLAEPLARRVGASELAPGVVEVPRRPDVLNLAGAIQGGIVAIAAEQAAMSLAERPVVAETFTVRYLRPIVVGAAHATARANGAVTVVDLTDAGSGKRTTLVTARLVDAD